MRLITLCFIFLLYACAGVGSGGAAEPVPVESIPIKIPEKPPAENGTMFALVTGTKDERGTMLYSVNE